MGSAELQFVHPQGASAELLGHLHELVIESGDDGSYGDHGGGADDHAEHGKEGTELMRAKRVERQQEVLANVAAADSHLSILHAQRLDGVEAGGRGGRAKTTEE